MKLLHGFLFIVTLLSLGACDPASTAPARIIPPTETIQVMTTTLATISVTAIPNSEKVFTPTLTKLPDRMTITSEEEKDIHMPVAQSLTMTIVYDNNPNDPRLSSAWGFSALVEYRDRILLFDTGGDGQMLMENMRNLGVDPTQIDSVVLSHAHADHTGGLTALLDTGAKPAVYLLASFPDSFKHQIDQFAQVSEVSPGQSLGEGLWTTGEMGETIPEQALVIQTQQGLVVITGCAHPGIVAIVEKAKAMFAKPVHLVMGGFHLGSKNKAEIDAILQDFRRLEVQTVAPCHCTGERAIKMIAAEYGKDFIQVGVGSVIRLEE